MRHLGLPYIGLPYIGLPLSVGFAWLRSLSGAVSWLCLVMTIAVWAGSSTLAFAQNQRTLNIIEAKLQLLERDLKNLKRENQALRESLEHVQIDGIKLEKALESALKKHEASQLSLRDELDKRILDIGEMERLLKSPLADLPEKTVADRLLRVAMSRLFSGDLDLAVRSLADFRDHFPQEKRLPQVLHRQAQALFLLRQCEGALEPLYTLLEKHSRYRKINDARWLLARCLEDNGEPLQARRYYAELVSGNVSWADDAARRLQFIDNRYGDDSKSRKFSP